VAQPATLSSALISPFCSPDSLFSFL